MDQNKNTLRILSAVVLIVIAGFLFYQRAQMPVVEEQQENEASSTISTQSTSSVPASGTVTSTAVKTFTVNGYNYAFSPSTLSVNKGDTVKIVFENSGGNHDLRIDEFKAATRIIQSGQSDTIEFVADKTGSFEYYCSVGMHRSMGMKGTLVVK